MKKKKTITVFGANGNVGGAFVRLAADAGYTLRAFVRTPEKFDNPDPRHIEVVRGDATDAHDVAERSTGRMSSPASSATHTPIRATFSSWKRLRTTS